MLRTSCHLLVLVTILSACSSGQSNKQTALPTGTWRATLQSPGGELPFGMDIARKTDSTYTVHVINGKERLPLDEATLTGDSVRIPIDLFEAEIVAGVTDSTLAGRFTRYTPTDTSHLPFTARHGVTYRFTRAQQPPQADLSGKWSVTFYNVQDSSQAVGVFEQQGNDLTGTFLTPTGDYRYLAGTVQGDQLKLSTFDGSHVYLFKARTDSSGNRLEGEFWAGTKGYKKWVARRDEKAALPDANSLTFLKPGYDQLTFSFPNPDGQQVSLQDPAYQNKVVIVQILGSWCPNCMDETQFLAPWYRQNKDRGVEIIGLAFEKNPEFSVSAPKVRRMVDRFDIDYEVLFAGSSDNKKASEALPMLNKVVAFPTTIFIDKQGKVRRIHTGFSGPGTGKYYDEFVEEFNLFVDKLLAEEGKVAGLMNND